MERGCTPYTPCGTVRAHRPPQWRPGHTHTHTGGNRKQNTSLLYSPYTHTMIYSFRSCAGRAPRPPQWRPGTAVQTGCGPHVDVCVRPTATARQCPADPHVCPAPDTGDICVRGWVCVCVEGYVWVWVCVWMWVDVFRHMYVHITLWHIFTYITYIPTQIRTWTTRTRTRTHTHTHTHIIYTHTLICVHIYQYIHVHIHTYTYLLTGPLSDTDPATPWATGGCGQWAVCGVWCGVHTYIHIYTYIYRCVGGEKGSPHHSHNLPHTLTYTHTHTHTHKHTHTLSFSLTNTHTLD